MTNAYVPEFLADTSALASHEDLLKLLQTIKNQRQTPRKMLMQQVYNASGTDSNNMPIVADQYRAFNIGSCILCLMDWRNGEALEVLVEDDIPLPSWQDSASIYDYVQEVFPMRRHPYFENHLSRRNTIPVISARRLEKAGLHIEATTDIRRHLEMDLRKKVVRMFDCTSVLKETLLTAREDANPSILPRALVVEVLETIYEVLFPSDSDSRTLLKRYVLKLGFDEDLLRYEAARFRREDDPQMRYEYFGTRLADIYDELRNPAPRTALDRWFERKSGSQRNMLIATMIGVFIAVITGVLGLGVAGFQSWVTYQQWKHPVKDQ